MPLNRAAIKYNARICAQSNPSSMLVTILFLFLGYVIQFLQGRISMLGDDWLVSLVYRNFPEYYDYFLELFNQYFGYYNYSTDAVFTPLLLAAAVFLVLLGLCLSLLSVGYTIYCLGMMRGAQVSYRMLTAGFPFVLKFIGISIVASIFIFLWSLLFLIPGIVAAYRYSMALYIMVDEPGLGVMDCIRKSKRITAGRKLELFVLDLSFLGWQLLGALTFGIIYIWKLPYIRLTSCMYYDALRRASDGTYYGSETPS